MCDKVWENGGAAHRHIWDVCENPKAVSILSKHPQPPRPCVSYPKFALDLGEVWPLNTNSWHKVKPEGKGQS